MSQYYEKQFIKEWKESTKQEKRPITVVAALLVERKEKLKVVLLTAGTRIKHECSYFTKTNDDTDIEPFWGLCDGHAEAVCYRLASFYLMNEIYKQNDGVDSILEKQSKGCYLKDGIKLHFFTSHPPCGFFAKPERHFLSWKRPFIGKPHSLQCSSIILIAAYLGIQGPLSHLFVKPVYVSSITIPRYQSVTALHGSYIKERLDQFWIRLTSCNKDNDTTPILGSQYYFNCPHVEVVDVNVKKLFRKYFVPYIDEDKKLHQVTYTKQGALKTAGAVPDVIGNANIFALVFTLEDGIGSTIYRQSVVELISKLLRLPHEVKQKHLDLLREAQKRLIMALNVSEALEEQKKLVAQKLAEHCSIRYQKAAQMIKLGEKCNTNADELSAYFEELDANLKRLKDSDDIDKMREALWNSLHYQRMLTELERLQEIAKSKGANSEFSLELLGCDWSRYMHVICAQINS